MLSRTLALVLSLVLGAPSAALRAQAPELLEINTLPLPNPSSAPDDIVIAGSALVFAATRADVGRELFSMPRGGGGAPVALDLRPGPLGSDPQWMVSFSSFALFAANDGVNGEEVWITDGTNSGTRMLADLEPGPAGCNPLSFAQVGSMVVFTASANGLGQELYVTDLTTAGTRLLRDLEPGRGSSFPVQFTTVGNELFFQARESIYGVELWRTDGTAAGTRVFVDLEPGPLGSFATRVTPVGNGTDFFFHARTAGSSGWEVWFSDATPAGTRLLRRFGSGLGPSEMVAFHGKVLFPAADTGMPWELWESDGTVAGTGPFTQFGTVTDNLVPLGGVVLFNTFRAGELWRTDGTSQGTYKLADVEMTAYTLPWPRRVVAAGELVFAGDDGNGYELWATDGSVTGTRQIADLRSGNGGSDPGAFVVDPTTQEVHFSADDGVAGRELWRTDRTTAGTELRANVWTVPASYTPGSNPDSLVDYYGIALLSADDGVAGPELWRTDGTAAGTRLVKDITAGGRGFNPTSITVAGSLAYFSQPQYSYYNPAALYYLWRTDGTSAGTFQLFSNSVYAMEPWGDQLFFSGYEFGSGVELWRTDGTVQGTQRVADLVPGSGSGTPRNLTAAGEWLYFQARDSRGIELWRSDGTATGTQLVADLEPGRGSSRPSYLEPLRDQLLFAATSTSSGSELWVTDGTSAGTSQLDLWPGATSSKPKHLVALGDAVYFVAADQNDGTELWRTDGTPASTFVVADIGPGPESSWPDHLTPVGDLLYFTAWTASEGRELWRTDGTAAGTRLVEDLVPGPGGSDPMELTAAGSEQVYFSAQVNITTGREPYVADGSGVRFLGNLASGSSDPLGFTLSAGKVLFAAFQESTGRELWIHDPGPTTQSVGSGCGAAAQTLASGDPRLGSTVTVTGSGASGSTTAFLLAGLPQPPVPWTSGCPVYLERVTLLAAPNVSGSTWSVAVPLPNALALHGLRVALQAVVGPTSAPLGADLTQALWWRMGQR